MLALEQPRTSSILNSETVSVAKKINGLDEYIIKCESHVFTNTNYNYQQTVRVVFACIFIRRKMQTLTLKSKRFRFFPENSLE